MSKNIDESHNLYKEEYSKELILKTMLEISKNVSSKKRRVIFVIFPQLFYLKKKSKKNYQKFFRGINNQNSNLKILDLTSNFMKKNYKDLFVNDKYGGHLNPKGNKFVADEIKKMINYENYSKK